MASRTGKEEKEKEKETKYLIITAGLTGSGKSSLIDKVFEILKGEDKSLSSFDKEGIIHINIDELVERNLTFKKEMCDVLQGYSDKCSSEGRCIEETSKEGIKKKECKEECIKEKANEKKEIKINEEIYYNLRRGKVKVDEVETLDEINDKKFLDALKGEKRVIVYETVGNNPIDWLFTNGGFTEEINDKKYTIIFAYTFVTEFDKIKERIGSRIHITEYLDKCKDIEKLTRVNALRIPTTNIEDLQNRHDDIIKELKRRYRIFFLKIKNKGESYIYNDFSNKFPNRFRILLFDNTLEKGEYGYTNKPIYDSESGIHLNITKLGLEIQKIKGGASKTRRHRRCHHPPLKGGRRRVRREPVATLKKGRGYYR